MKKFNWKDYLHFSKKERRFAIWIIIVVSAITGISICFQGKEETDAATTLFDKELSDSAEKLVSRTDYSTASEKINSDTIIKKHLFVFDPNTLDEAGWKQLGISGKTVNTIINYRNKGGKFYKPEDIKKIYGIDAATAQELVPYISIKSNDNNSFKQNYLPENDKQYNYPVKKYSSININTATEEEWKSLPGIGEVLSKRIIKFRNSKGGFTSVDEVADTYGLQDSVFQKIKPYLKME